MSLRRVVLDTGPLGLLCHPAGGADARRAQGWARELVGAGVVLVVPEIADYELRRELLRAGRRTSVMRLEVLEDALAYAPLTTAVMRAAAQLWADARNAGRPTAAPEALDGDVILAAQAGALSTPGDSTVVATTNPAHLVRYIDARDWAEIT